MHIAFGWIPLKQFYPGLNGVEEMTAKSNTAVLEDLDCQLASIVKYISAARKTVASIRKKNERHILKFFKKTRSVSWAGGRIKYRKGADAPYRMCRTLYEAGPEGLSHAELAEKVYGDELADVLRCAYGLRDKLDESGCPLRLRWNAKKFWLEDEKISGITRVA